MSIASSQKVNEFPQYLAFHASEVELFQSCLADTGQSLMGRILETVGTRGTADRRLAVSFTVSYLNIPCDKPQLQNLARNLRGVLELSSSLDLPVLVHLDGVNWWGARPDLWNWWDPDQPGYDPKNAYNVEWYDWGPEYAVKIGWRNWGRQIRVRPQPNLASPRFLAAQDEMLESLIPVVLGWYEQLNEDQRYLLAGLVLGWEVSPYVQAFYYPEGNQYLMDHPDDPAHDPREGIEHSIPLGYAAATVLGRDHQGRVRGEDIDSICGFYIDHITSKAREIGVPADKLITHGIIHKGTRLGGAHSGVSSLSPNAIPGWSFYDMSPTAADKLLDRISGEPWAAIEFQPWGLTDRLINSFFDHRNCRYVNIYNWSSIRDDSGVIRTIREVLR